MALHDPDLNAPPLHPLPTALVLAVAPLIAVEALFQAAEAGIIGGPMAIGWRLRAIEWAGVFPALFDHARLTGQAWGEVGRRALFYPLVHTSALHALFAVVLLLALGKQVTKVFAPWTLFPATLAGGVVAALAYGIAFADRVPLIGAHPAAYAVLGLYTWLLWSGRAPGGKKLAAFRLAGMLFALQLLFAAMFGGARMILPDWVGFATGFALAPILGPGGGARLARLRARLRER